MTFNVAARVREISTTIGADTYTREGAPIGYQSFDVIGANNYTRYFATDGVNWEEGIGRVLTAPSRLERTVILASSNAGAAVNWGAGTRTLRCAPIAGMDAPRRLAKSVAGGAGTTVLTQDEQRREILSFTGALTGNRVIEVDTTTWTWVVENATTGAFSLTIKTAAGIGVIVPQGAKVLAVCDGGSVVPGGAPAYASAGSIVPSEFPSGTAMLFRQTGAPVGWTKQTGHNDKALRIVSGTVGSGGATAFTSVFGAGKVTGGKSLAIADIPSHNHPADSHAHSVRYISPSGAAASGIDVASRVTNGVEGTVINDAGVVNGTTVTLANTGGGGSHDHTLSLDLHYVDVIEATKD